MIIRKTSLKGTEYEGQAGYLVDIALSAANKRYGGNLELKPNWNWDANGNYRFGITVFATRRVSLTERGPRGGIRYEPAPGVAMSAIFPWRTERPIHAACWHAFRDFLGELFILCPSAVVVTALATYRRFDGFMRDFPKTGHRNAGSQMYPLELQSKCYCGDFDAAYGHIPDWLTAAYETWSA